MTDYREPQAELRTVEELRPYGRSLRKHSEASVEWMISSIREFTFKIPLLITSDGEIIDGHLRLMAAQRMGLSRVPVILCDEWSEEQRRAFRLMANRSVEWAEWDLDEVLKEITELTSRGYDTALTGFTTREIDDLLAGLDDLTDDPVMPLVPENPVTRRGDLWVCGSHRVFCADSTDAEAVARLIGAAKPRLTVTDPPYGVEYDPEWREQAGLGRQRQTGKVLNDDRVDWSDAYRLFPGDVAYVWHAGIHTVAVAQSLEQSGFEIRSQIIWSKQHFALSRGHYHWQHEPCWYVVRRGASAAWCGDRKQSTVWEVSNLNPFGSEGCEDAVTGHGTQKPIELMRRPLLNHTQPGEAVYDPFLGSGSTLIAAEKTRRACYGLELDPGYVDKIVERWQNLTGREAALEDGRTFGQVRAERSAQVSEAEVTDAAA